MNQGFLDEVKIFVKGGDGGNGCLAFHREKFVPKGGPSGGNGGRGGNLYLVADENISNFNDFLHGVHFRADTGKHGEGSKCHGSNAPDKTLYVPCGTLIVDPDTEEVLADLAWHGQIFVAARGGIGGRGNASFASHTYRVPRFAQRGEPGEERWLRLVLKMIAQVGIIGFPNAGKSTLLSVISAARPRIAAYPFTTLVPNLGMVWLDDSHRALFADIPGLIEGAHQGVGLGTRFLRHVERTRVLVHLLDASTIPEEQPLTPYRTIREELTHYGKGLEQRPEIVVLNKIDLPEAAQRLEALERAYRAAGLDVIAISAKDAVGVDRLVERVSEAMQKVAEEEARKPRWREPEVALAPANPDEDDAEDVVSEDAYGLEGLVGIARSPGRRQPATFTVRRDNDKFVVEGAGVERMIAMADLDNEEAVSWIQVRLQRMGVEDALKHAGITEGAPVEIRGFEFEYHEEGEKRGRPTRKERRTIASEGKPVPGRRPSAMARSANRKK